VFADLSIFLKRASLSANMTHDKTRYMYNHRHMHYQVNFSSVLGINIQLSHFLRPDGMSRKKPSFCYLKVYNLCFGQPNEGRNASIERKARARASGRHNYKTQSLSGRDIRHGNAQATPFKSLGMDDV